MSGQENMNVCVDRTAFLRGLQLVQRIINPRQTLPILANVLLDTDGDSLRMTATDLEVGARIVIPAKISRNGAITLSARKLLEIVKELPAAELSMKLQDNAWVGLRCGGVAYTLVGLPPGDYPAVEPPASMGWMSLEAKVLRSMLAQTSFAVSHDESRDALNGVLFSVQGEIFRLAATDGHRFALASRVLSSGASSGTGIVPRKAVQELARVLSKVRGEVQIGLGEGQFGFKMPNFFLTARLLKGPFPAYEQVIPKRYPHCLILSRVALIAAVKRVSACSEGNTKSVNLLLSSGGLQLSADSPELGVAEEALPVDYTGNGITIKFNSRYLLEALGPIETEQVAIELKDSSSVGVFKSPENDEYQCVLMPMRI